MHTFLMLSTWPTASNVIDSNWGVRKNYPNLFTGVKDSSWICKQKHLKRWNLSRRELLVLVLWYTWYQNRLFFYFFICCFYTFSGCSSSWLFEPFPHFFHFFQFHGIESKKVTDWLIKIIYWCSFAWMETKGAGHTKSWCPRQKKKKLEKPMQASAADD